MSGTPVSTPISGRGVCAPAGFTAAGVAAGIKSSSGLDLALVVSDREASVAGTFTSNAAAAPPVRLCRDRIKAGRGRGVVVNSGCANSFTGKRGYDDAVEMAAAAEEAVGAREESFFACSTGHIGSFLPMEKIKSGIKEASSRLSPSDDDAAQAIMTTDTRPKRFAVLHASGFVVGGIAKGAGMISPKMAAAGATMLSFVTTDAEVEAPLLQKVLSKAVSSSFNRVIVDGDRSTNDTVLLFANGASGVRADGESLSLAVGMVCRALAEAIVADGEGATKLASIMVVGAASEEDAERAARQVAESLLVKTMLYGGDANWGRIAAALGQSGAKADFDRLSISMAGYELLSEGVAASDADVEEARRVLQSEPKVSIVCDLFAGNASWEILTTDTSPQYVELNAEYEV